MQRVSIVLGVRRRELLDPVHRYIGDKAIDILTQASTEEAFCYATANEAISRINTLSDSSIVRLYGVWDELCVSGAAQEIILRNLSLELPLDLIVSHRTAKYNHLSAQETARRVIKENNLSDLYTITQEERVVYFRKHR